MGAGQVKAADYFLEPNIVSSNSNSGGGGVGAAAGALGGLFGGAGRVIGGLAGGINVKKGEANVTLSIVNARTTEEEALTEGYFRKRDLSWGGGGGAGWRQRLSKHGDRPDHRARLPRRLQETGHGAGRIEPAAPARTGARGSQKEEGLSLKGWADADCLRQPPLA